MRRGFGILTGLMGSRGDLRGDMKEIRLTQGKVTLVDDEYFEWLDRWKWCYGSSGYAMRTVRRSDNKPFTLRMHRLIALPHDNEFTDHINQDKLDNRRSNLRVCSTHNNSCNREKQKNNTSGYKGVYKRDDSPKWEARIQIKSKQISLGWYSSKHLAAVAYNNAALHHFGEFAYLNQIEVQI